MMAAGAGRRHLGPAWLESGHGFLHGQPAGSGPGPPAHRRPPVRAEARRGRPAPRQYVLRSVWNDVQPGAEDENAFLESHSWEEYAQWHLALTDGASDQTKARDACG